MLGESGSKLNSSRSPQRLDNFQPVIPAPVAPKRIAAPAVPSEVIAAPKAVKPMPRTRPACARPTAAPADAVAAPRPAIPAARAGATAGAARPPVTARRIPPPAAARATFPRFHPLRLSFCRSTKALASKASNNAPPISFSQRVTSCAGTPIRPRISIKAARLRASNAPLLLPSRKAKSSRPSSQARGMLRKRTLLSLLWEG
mmetsp:Transcript_14418/g.27928  ORF Transcript_14418/g.27928 Transcript_14418/m.27928 type:complete len:202 (-) Transcript_14418:24-629(-)